MPCSLLKGVFSLLEQKEQRLFDTRYIPAIREDSAIGVATGLFLGGKPTVVLMQNSGLGYSLNVLTSLNIIYKLPVLLIISWRGAYGNDAVEHTVIGEKLPQILESVEIPYFLLDEKNVETIVYTAVKQMKVTKQLVSILVRDSI